MTGNRRNNENKEKRTHTRKTLVTKVTYKVLLHSKGETLSQNISEGGLCLILNRELAPGATLELKIDMPGKDAKIVEIFAEVVWQQKTEMGFLTGLKIGSAN
jgi:c-di-GMP-binding flagellar brake protein YcgR